MLIFAPRSIAFQLAMIASLALTLTACGGSAKLDGRPVTELGSQLAKPPDTLIADCDDPTQFADGALGAGAVERAWAQDRSALVSCRDRHGATVRFYRDRDAGLSKGGK